MDQAEELRNIIKAKNQLNAKPAARVITVTSGKGGVGKSNTAINLAVQLKKEGKKVVILDADFGLANIEIMFGAVPKYNLGDLVNKGKSIREIITWGPMEVGFISGGSGISGLANMDKNSLNYIIQNLTELDEIADVIIIDTGAGIADAVMEFLVASGEILLVTTPEPTSITDSYSVIKALHMHPRFSKEESKVRVITNRVEKEADGVGLFEKFNNVVEKYLDVPITYLGAVPQDGQLVQAVMQQMPISIQNPKAKSAQAYERIAAKLLDKEEGKTQERRGMAAFFSRIVSGRKMESR
ncbi:MAG: MinD/ParA family protein [Lachnospiraceae bacterium]|nr:MinD/ParA family protein [Lachnospiraceae bacterium]